MTVEETAVDQVSNVEIDIDSLTIDEISTFHSKCVQYTTENITNFPNNKLCEILNQYQVLHMAAFKQLEKNLEETKRLDELMQISAKEQSENEIVKLNIGGKFFATFKSTLMKFKNSYFYGLLNSGRFSKGEDESYFIDRDPTHFSLVMTFMRSGNFSIEGLTEKQLDEISAEFDYYLLPLPSELEEPEVIWDASRKSKDVTFFDNCLKAKKENGYNGWNCAVIGTNAVYEYSVVVNWTSDNHIMIGFSPLTYQNSFQENGQNYLVHTGCFLYSQDCAIYCGNQIRNTNLGPLGNGDRVTLKKKGSTIRFFKNGVDLGIVVNSFDGRPMYPLVDIHSRGGSVTLVQ